MTGARRAEAYGLRWRDVDIDKSLVTITYTITSAAGKTSHSDTKNGRSRTIDLDSETVAVLRAHLQAQRELRWSAPAGPGVTGYSPLRMARLSNPDTVSEAWDRLIARSGLPRIRPVHDFRHSHAAHLLGAAVNIKIVSERLGHADVGFTLTVYGHLMPGQQAAAASAVAALVDSPLPNPYREAESRLA